MIYFRSRANKEEIKMRFRNLRFVGTEILDKEDKQYEIEIMAKFKKGTFTKDDFGDEAGCIIVTVNGSFENSDIQLYDSLNGEWYDVTEEEQNLVKEFVEINKKDIEIIF
jgi:hypothetical protein